MARVKFRAKALLLLTLAACTSAASASKPAIRIGALYPQAGALAHYGTEELRGVKIATELFNARGGVRGRDVVLDVGKADTVADAWRDAFLLARRGRPAILGTYSSTISLAASEAAHRNKIVYWETGAVADLVTSRGYDEVFRLGPSGATLAAKAAGFATEVLAPRFRIATKDLRVAVTYENDPYGSSVGDGIRREAVARRFRLVGSYPYDPETETFAGIIRALRAVKPDIVVAASYLHDGARFREALVKANLPTVKAMIGKCAAFYTPEMAKLLGSKLDGVFVADKPMDIAPTALNATGLALERDFVAAFTKRYGSAPEAAAYMGFSGAWALFRALSVAKSLTPKGIEAAARTLDEPMGSLPNGAGVRFAGPGDRMEGQNDRAFGVVWQWQNGKPVIVWPRSAARGEPLLSSR
jgi:branched-chain amino acid transport system substrate-binding protein